MAPALRLAARPITRSQPDLSLGVYKLKKTK
jgi:hypothetical protein